MNQNICGILFPRMHTHSVIDTTGCYLPHAHFGSHEFKIENKIIQWETDFDCDCEDCQSDEPDDWCILYRKK